MKLRAVISFAGAALLVGAAAVTFRFLKRPSPRGLHPAPERVWVDFAPKPERDADDSQSVIDLRRLNQAHAGVDGRVVARNGAFYFQARQGDHPVRFWGVNGPAGETGEELRREARQLASYGVNLVRLLVDIHDEEGAPRPAGAQRAAAVVEAMKAEGIYTHLSLYFPLAFKPKAGAAGLRGYDGQRPAFGALFFNPEFQRVYDDWWRTLFSARTSGGQTLLTDPAVFGVELVNEDSLLFWTFNPETVPAPELATIEQRFATWLVARHGSLAAAQARWGDVRTPRDDVAAGRMGLRSHWNLFHDRTPRDQDTVRFLVETQRQFYDRTTQKLRALGYDGLVTASNWHTASPQHLGPLEKYSYGPGDFLDRHGYLGCNNQGPESSWSLQPGQTYADRSALRFDPEAPGAPLDFFNPVMDTEYQGAPSVISETTWTRPNRYRSEAPLYLAAYASLQGTDAVVHFFKDGLDFAVKPRFFMQPWTLASPALLGQFPAAAFIYRQGLLQPGAVVADVTLALDELFALTGTPLFEHANLDRLRVDDVPRGHDLETRWEGVIDPLVHLVGRARIGFTAGTGVAARVNLGAGAIDRRAQRVRSSTGELQLDYGAGRLTIAAPAVQGVSGDLSQAGPIELPALTVSSPLDLVHIVALALDSRPLVTAQRLLLQVMTEEQATGFASEPAPNGERRIRNLGTDPWQIRRIEGHVRLRRADAGHLTVTPLDPRGRPIPERRQWGNDIHLEPTTLYYLIEAPGAREN
jgi:hypothetical protein